MVEVGSEYSYRGTFPRAQMAAAAVLLLVLASVFLPLSQQPVAAAYVTLDINPSVELTVSSSRKVISVQALNEDGAEVLEGLKLKGAHLEKAIKLFMQAA